MCYITNLNFDALNSNAMMWLWTMAKTVLSAKDHANVCVYVCDCGDTKGGRKRSMWIRGANTSHNRSEFLGTRTQRNLKRFSSYSVLDLLPECFTLLCTLCHLYSYFARFRIRYSHFVLPLFRLFGFLMLTCSLGGNNISYCNGWREVVGVEGFGLAFMISFASALRLLNHSLNVYVCGSIW